MKIFCDRLKETRGDISQKVFAASLGLNQQTYQRYESGVREPDLEQLHRIGVTCGVSIDWLLGLSERGGSAVNAPNNSGAIAVGAGAKATAGKDNKRTTTSSACDSCKYKKFSEAFKAIQTPD